MNGSWKEVTKDNFISRIGGLDVIIELKGNFPYTSFFKGRNGVIYGKIIASIPEGKALISSKYYLPNGGN